MFQNQIYNTQRSCFGGILPKTTQKILKCWPKVPISLYFFSSWQWPLPLFPLPPWPFPRAKASRFWRGWKNRSFTWFSEFSRSSGAFQLVSCEQSCFVRCRVGRNQSKGNLFHRNAIDQINSPPCFAHIWPQSLGFKTPLLLCAPQQQGGIHLVATVTFDDFVTVETKPWWPSDNRQWIVDAVISSKWDVGWRITIWSHLGVSWRLHTLNIPKSLSEVPCSLVSLQSQNHRTFKLDYTRRAWWPRRGRTNVQRTSVTSLWLYYPKRLKLPLPTQWSFFAIPQ